MTAEELRVARPLLIHYLEDGGYGAPHQFMFEMFQLQLLLVGARYPFIFLYMFTQSRTRMLDLKRAKATRGLFFPTNYNPQISHADEI